MSESIRITLKSYYVCMASPSCDGIYLLCVGEYIYPPEQGTGGKKIIHSRRKSFSRQRRLGKTCWNYR